MDIGALFGKKGMGAIMKLMSGNADIKSFLPIITDNLTDNDVQEIMRELTKLYVEENEKLGSDHVLTINLEPDFEKKSLQIVLYDVQPRYNSMNPYKRICLSEVTAAMISELLNKATAEPQQKLLSDKTQDDARG